MPSHHVSIRTHKRTHPNVITALAHTIKTGIPFATQPRCRLARSIGSLAARKREPASELGAALGLLAWCVSWFAGLVVCQLCLRTVCLSLSVCLFVCLSPLVCLSTGTSLSVAHTLIHLDGYLSESSMSNRSMLFLFRDSADDSRFDLHSCI